MKEHFLSLTYLVARSFLRRSATALVALLVLLLWLPQRAAAQGCPTLDTGDFTATLIAANSDCHTPARLSVIYRNAVAGFTAMTYSVSKDRTTWGTPVVTPRPGSEAVLPLDGWNEGDPIYIRATATCGTQQPRVVLPKIIYHVKTSADVLATPVVTPAGGCEATSGAVSVSLTGVSGFSRVQYKLERDPVRAGQQAVPVGNLTARSPYQQTLFFNLSPGRYTLHVRATPNCTPTAPGAAWKDGAYEWEQPVDVEHFSVIPTPILTRGTCPGGVTINVAKVVGIGGLRYEIWKKGQRAAGAPALQTATVTYPAFAHTFTGLPLGDYEVQATSTDCEAAATSSFSITQGELVQPQVTIVRHTYAGCAAGKIEVSLPGTTAACPVNFTLTPTTGGTPQVRNNVTTERDQFSGLAAGTYTLTAAYGGQTTTTPVEIKTVTPGVLKIKPTLAETYCSPTGKMDVTLEGGTLDESATLELSLDGNPVRSVNLNAGETTKTIEGLLPGGYNVTLRTECGAKVSTQTAIGTKHAPDLTINAGDARFDICQTPLKLKKQIRIGLSNVEFSSSDEENKALLAEMFSGAVYEIRDTLGKLLSSDLIPMEEILKKEFYGELYFDVQYPVTDSYIKFSLRMPCGFPTIAADEYTTAIENYSGNHSSVVKYPLVVETVRTGCDQFRLTLKRRDYTSGLYPLTVRLVDRATGLPVEEKHSTDYDDIVFENVPAGDYYYEFWGDCQNAPHHRSADIKVSNKDQYVISTPGAKGCEKLAYIQVDFNLGESSTTCKYTLYDEAGKLIREETYSGNNFKFNDIPPGRYKLKVEPALNPGDCPVEAFTKDIFINDYAVYPDHTLGLTPAEEIKNLTATLGPVLSNTNTLSFDYYNSPGEYTLKLTSDSGAPITKTVTIPNDGARKNTVHVTFENLPDNVSLHFTEGSCAFSGVRDYNLVKLATHKDVRDEYADIYDLKLSMAVPGCRKESVKLHFKLLEKGLPQRRTALVIKKRVYDQRLTVDSIASPNVITDWENKAGEDPSLYSFYYYYDGKLILTLEDQIPVQSSSTLTTDVQTLMTYPGEKGGIHIYKGNLGTNEHLHIRITETSSGRQLYDEIMPGTEDEHDFPLSPGTYTVHYEPLDGCFAGQEYEKNLEVPRGQYQFYAENNKMQCANDGVITVVAQYGYGVADQVNYEIIPDNGSPSIHGQTSTPSIAKEFPGLEKGCYTIKATAIVLRGFDGQPHSYEAENRACLETSYAEPLSVRNAPELSSPASSECGAGGAIGLEINGSRKANVRVFMTDNPAGPVSPRQELFQDSNGNWGKNLAPGAYKLFVTDGCMDIIVPNATVLQAENKGTAKTDNECISIDVHATNSNKLNFSYGIDLKDYPEHLRGKIATLIETQVVAPNAAPDESNWNQYGNNWNNNSIYYYYSSATRFNISEGFDILYRFSGCPGSMKRYHQVKGANKLCNPFNITDDPKTSTCDKTAYVLSRYDTGRPYRIRVTRIEDNQEIYNQVKTFTYDPDFPQQLKNEIILPNTSSYKFEITSVDEPMLVYTTSYNRVNRGPNYSVYGIHNITCTTARYQFAWATGGCHKKQWMIIRDKATGTEVARLHQWYDANNNPQFTVTEYDFERNKTYSMEIYDEANALIGTGAWTPQYNLAERFVYDDFNLDNLCDADAPKTISPANGLNSIYVEWDNGQGQRLYGDVQKVIVRNNATGKTFQSRRFEEAYIKVRPSTGQEGHPILKIRSWDELDPSGQVSKQNISPSLEPGEYTLEVYTSCDTKTSTFNITYKAPAESDVKLTNVQIDCDGKIKFTPTGTASLPNSTDPVSFSSYRIEGDDYTTYNWGDEGETYKPSGIVYYKLNLPDGQTCERRLYYNYTTQPLAFDKSSTVSFFCAGAHSGQINVGLKGGHKPYIYELRTLDGTLVEKKSAHGAVTFEHGSLGSRYRIEATDSCGLTHVRQDVLLQDPAAISGSITDRISVCDGDPVRIKAVKFPGATYTWTLPDGTHSHDQELSFVGTPDKAGKYTVDIQLNTCNATITGTYRVRIAHLSESAGTHTQRTCAGQSAVFAPADPVATVNGQPVDEDELEFQWQYTKTPTDANSWKPIFGATEKSVEYVAAYPGTYYLRRTTRLGDCVAVGGLCTLTVDPGITVTMSAAERRVVIDHKNPFLLTAGLITGPAARTYVWQRSLDGKTWTDVGTDVSYTETQRLAPVVYYRRIIRSGTCETKGEPITVIFKRRYPAMVNPQLRQRVDQHW